MIRKIFPILVLMMICSVLQARPLDIIIVTSRNSSEEGYPDFLREIYRDNAEVEIDSNRYDESLSDTKKEQLAAADLIIVSSDNDGGDYNGDSAFWASLGVPILSHNISICRSNDHANWDWFGGDKTSVSVSTFYPTEPNEAIFKDIDLTGGSISLFDFPLDFSVGDEPYAGHGKVLATTDSGLPVLVSFDGNEPNYYDGSLYGPSGARRIYFAMPEEPSLFFANATNPAKTLLRNAIVSLLPECWLGGDMDCDFDVDMEDFAVLSDHWFWEIASSGPNMIEEPTVNVDDLEMLAAFWLEGVDHVAPLPDPAEWIDEPTIQDGGFVQMKADGAEDDLHGVEYRFECLENDIYSSGWQYEREYILADLPTGVDLSYQVRVRDTSSHLNETYPSSIETVRCDGLFYRSADASAAMALDEQRFIMADDEDNVLRVYNWNLPASEPNRETDVSVAIGVDPGRPEADIEGAALFNGRIFWITSHGRSRYGDYWSSRYRLFATTIASDGTAVVDGVYSGLIDDLIQYDRVWNLGLEAAIGTAGDHIDPASFPDLAPKVNGLNIEGLCTTADGTKMLIGFRNPRPLVDGKIMALVIPLANPEAVVIDGENAILEAPLLIDLDDLGIRSIDYSDDLAEYLIVAGSHQGGENEPVQYLYNYSFASSDRDKLATFSDDMTPEAILQFPNSNEIHLLSDDGTRMIDIGEGPVMNKLLPREHRRYRTRTIVP